MVTGEKLGVAFGKIAKAVDELITHLSDTGKHMTTDEKKKIDGIADNANNYVHPTYTARTGVPTANQTPAFGGTFSISQPISDTSGHITNITTRTVKIPNSVASASAAGLMSAADKNKLTGLTEDWHTETISGGASEITYLAGNFQTGDNVELQFEVV